MAPLTATLVPLFFAISVDAMEASSVISEKGMGRNPSTQTGIFQHQDSQQTAPGRRRSPSRRLTSPPP